MSKNNLRLLIGLLRCFACSKTTRIKPEDCLRYNNIPESFWKWWNSDDAWSPHAIATSGAWVHVPSLMEGQDLVDLEQFLIFFLFMLAMEIITTYKSIKNPQTIYFISFFFSIVFYPLPIGLTFFFFIVSRCYRSPPSFMAELGCCCGLRLGGCYLWRDSQQLVVTRVV